MLIFLGIIGYQEIRVRRLAEESRQAELTAARERARAEDAEERVREVTEETARRLAEADRLITQMRASLESARASERAALASRQQILTRRDVDIGSVATETDMALANSMQTLAERLYPGEGSTVLATSDGFYLDRAGAEVFAKSLIETGSRREEVATLEQVAEQRLEQINSLEAILGQKDDSLEALNTRMSALEDQVLSLQRSNLAYRGQVEALEDELRARKRKNFWSRWGNRSLSVAALVAGVFIGRRL